MKIIDVSLTPKKTKVLYSGQRIKKDQNGEAVLERGRPVTEDVTGVSNRVKIETRYLVEEMTKEGRVSYWLSEPELAIKVGKKKFRKMVREFSTSDRGKGLIKQAEGNVYDKL